jgi:hypothetical protein
MSELAFGGIGLRRMNDISQPVGVGLVKTREDGRGQGNARDPGNQARKAAEAYQSTNKNKPVDDRITILGIPAEQITPATQAALASLVAEVNFLRGAVRRLEGAVANAKRDPAHRTADIIPADLLIESLNRLASEPMMEGASRTLVLAYLSTFEDVRRSSGLLAANTLLADMAQRMVKVEFTPWPEAVMREGELCRFRLAGFAGGSTLLGVADLPAGAVDETHISQQVRDQCLENGFNVGGIEMTVAMSVAAVIISPNEGAVTALARADHLLRGGNI